jgi:hypothetical protein
LIKELSLINVQIYYDNTGQIIIPMSLIESATNEGDPKKVFETVSVDDIVNNMSSVFTA